MIKIFITENTYEKIKGEIIFQGCLEEGRIACQKCDNGYLIDFYNTSTDIDLKYTLVEEIFKKAPNDGNYWTINDEQFSLTEQEALKAFFRNSEGKDDYLWSSRKILGDIINDKNLVTLEQLQELAETPFSGMLLFDEYDYKRLFWPYSSNLTLPIKSEDTDIIVFNRYIKYDFDITRGKVKFRNCVIEGNIDIARSEWVEFSQCIILGNLSIRDTDQVYISSCNIKSFSVIASKNLTLDIQQSKIYRYVSFDNTVAKLVLYKNVFFEPYIVHTRYLDETTKMCVNQFKIAKINKRMLKRITEKGEIKIKNESCFYLTFIYNKPIESAAIEDVALNMVTGLLEHGDLTKNHHLYADLKYKKALYSNKGVKKFFVFLTGAFYKPSRWLIYIICSTLLFAAMYSFVPGICFTNSLSNELCQMDVLTSIYYSICQIIGTNPTRYIPIETASIVTAVQSVLNTVFFGNLVASYTRKYIREDM